MFFNLKYHIASLVAVFLALGLGILIGSAMPGDNALVKQQQQLTGLLESQLDLLRQKNESLLARVGNLEMDNNIQRQFGYQVLPELLGGKLNGRSVAIIETAGCVTPDEMIAALKMAGAAIQTTTVFNGAKMRDKDALLKKLNWPDMDEKKLTAKIGQEIARAILTGETRTLNILAGEQLLKVSGRYGHPVDDVVIIGGSPDKGLINTENLDYPIIDCFRSRRVNIYGVEESRVAYSYMRDYQKKGITTVDNIDTIPGQVSLVYAMTGQPGWYGIKSTARKLLPDMENGVPVNAR
ncbi:MAG: copper transporter [Bacillota bacterium]